MKNIKLNNLTIFFLFVAVFSGYIKNALYILFIVLFHELGHLFIAYIFKFKIKSIEIYPFGGISIIERHLNTRIYKEILLSIGGILFQLILLLIIKDPLFTKYNISILIFNLFPIIPLDGSKILFEIYNLFFSFKRSIKLSYISSFIFIIIYFLLNYRYELNNYLIISLFIIKTYEYFKNKDLYFNKFILERMIHDDIEHTKISNNDYINKYKKDYKYYYFIKGKIIAEKDYLQKYINIRK